MGLGSCSDPGFCQHTLAAKLGKFFRKTLSSKSLSALISRNSISMSSSWISFFLIHASVLLASSSRPFFTSHRGEKGMNHMPQASKTAGMPWMMDGRRHARSDWLAPVPPM